MEFPHRHVHPREPDFDLHPLALQEIGFRNPTSRLLIRVQSLTEADHRPHRCRGLFPGAGWQKPFVSPALQERPLALARLDAPKAGLRFYYKGSDLFWR